MLGCSWGFFCDYGRDGVPFVHFKKVTRDYKSCGVLGEECILQETCLYV